MRFRTQYRLTNANDKGQHVHAYGLRVGYWPCLKAPFVQLTFGKHQFEAWYGLPSYLATGGRI